jgi:hypothetical protein
MRAVLAHLTPAEVLQAREVSLMLTMAKARMRHGFPPPDPAIEVTGTESVPKAEPTDDIANSA